MSGSNDATAHLSPFDPDETAAYALPDPAATTPEATTADAATVDAAVLDEPPAGRPIALLVAAAVGSLVAVALGVYGRLHEPTFFSVNVAGFSGPQSVKAWLTTGAFVLALVQLASALIMWGKVAAIAPPTWIGGLHRWSGRIAALLTVPVAVHCLYALGFDPSSPRVLIHSLLGCFFYGVFVVKMLVLGKRGLPGWTLPVVGGLVLATLTGLWLSASLWFYATFGLTF